MQTVYNKDGVLNARRAIYKGKRVIVTHKNPATSELWVEEDEDNVANNSNKKKVELDCWVKGDSVEFVK